MNFLDFINDQQRNLKSHNYVEVLWCRIDGSLPLNDSISEEDEELYRSHVPLDFTKFLKNCVQKLRDLKLCSNETIEWNRLDHKYLSTLILFALEQEDVTMDGVLYAANMFILINSIDSSFNRFFNKISYLKILKILSNFNKSQEIASNIVIFLMDDFKTFLSKFEIPHDVIMSTISIVHDYTYYSNDVFENITTDVSYENLGYIAFVSLKVLTEKLLRQKKDKDMLYPILLCLASSLQSVATSNLNRSVKIAHQKNVRLFIRKNFHLFSSETSCLVTNILKFICLSPDYDEFEAIALLIQQLPCETHLNVITFLQNAFFISKVESRKHLLNLVLPVLYHPAKHETNRKRQIQTEIFVHNIATLFMDHDEQIKEHSLKIITELSENPLGKRVLKKIMSNTRDNINKTTIQDVLYIITDKTWSKKAINTNYIRLMCNLLVIRKDLVTVRALNRLREICRRASPNDLKPCILYLKRLLTCYASKSNVVMYVLSIFVKQILHPMATSAFFAKELYEYMFSHISGHKEDDFIWNIINYLISNNFDVSAIFEKFHSLNLLSKQQVQMILEYQVHNNNSYSSALKLLGVMLQFVPYNECRYLHEKLQDSINSSDTQLLKTQHLIVYALIKIIEKKKPADCSLEEINEYRKMQVLVSQTFFDQMFPSACVKYVIVLLGLYENLIEEDIGWDAASFSYFEEHFGEKLRTICNKRLLNYVYLSRDIGYISELVTLRKGTLSENNFEKLRRIVTVTKHSHAFSEYLKQHSMIWSACILLYIKICFIQSDLIPECVSNLEVIMCVADEQVQLPILYGLLDICNMHLQYYDPLVPHLFNALQSKNAYIRFISSKIIMLLINDGHLRLMDGQYFLFMGLLSDKKDIISRSTEIFIKEQFMLHHQQTIARYFVPSVIHYNYYYEHPTIVLSKTDQDVLKKQTYSWNDRACIYYHLYHFLSDTVKFNILNQIQNEILAKILNKTLPSSSHILRILEDVLIIILYTIPEDKIININYDTEYYNAEIKRIKNDLLVTNLQHCQKNNEPVEQRVALKNVLTVLLQLLYSDINQNAKNCQNLLFTILVLTEMFYSTIKHIVNEESSLLKRLYKNLEKFYLANKDHFAFCLLTVNPCNLPVLSPSENEVFYIQEFKHFELIPPYISIGDNFNSV